MGVLILFTRVCIMLLSGRQLKCKWIPLRVHDGHNGSWEARVILKHELDMVWRADQEDVQHSRGRLARRKVIYTRFKNDMVGRRGFTRILHGIEAHRRMRTHCVEDGVKQALPAGVTKRYTISRRWGMHQTT